jgi:phage terminase large subunit GpA-like protein
VLLLTAGVDVQGGGGAVGERLVLTVWGWGRGEEGWHIAHYEIDGDPQQTETLDQLDAISETRWRREDGVELQIALGGIDDGGLATKEVRDWCRTRAGKWAPMKGISGKGRPLIDKGKAVFVDRKNQASTRRDVLLYPVGYDTSIQHLQGRLRQETPGPGYLHFGEASTDQFLAEVFPWKKLPKRQAGQTVYEWKCPPGSRDEGGDCTRMAYAALQLVSRRYARGAMWDRLAQQLTTPAAPAAVERRKGTWLSR